MLFAETISFLLSERHGPAILVEDRDGAQIIFQRASQISLGLLDLPADQKGLAVSQRAGRGAGFLLQRGFGDRATATFFFAKAMRAPMTSPCTEPPAG